MIAVILAWVVETGMPVSGESGKQTAPARSAEKPQRLPKSREILRPARLVFHRKTKSLRDRAIHTNSK